VPNSTISRAFARHGGALPGDIAKHTNIFIEKLNQFDKLFISTQDVFKDITNKTQNISHITRIFRFIRIFKISHTGTI